MAVTYLKRAERGPTVIEPATTERVQDMLRAIEQSGAAAVRRFSRELDGWDPLSFVVDEDEVMAKSTTLPERVQADITQALENVQLFAREQRDTLRDLDLEVATGVTMGHRHIPVSSAGCYVPGGRYPHVASALMSIGTAKTAGVPFVVAAAPPTAGGGIHPATLFAMHRAGADVILCLGGVQAVAAMAFGLFTERPVDLVVGPGNRFVAEAKRLLFGRVGIDCLAGPTEILVIADGSADPRSVALDLVSQAEHGPDSPCVLVTTSRELAQAVERSIPLEASAVPSEAVVLDAWRAHGEIVLVYGREEAAAVADDYASEHVQVHAEDLDWWLERLRNYGSLFLGEETTVAYGDKATGPNHILPTGRAARYTGGLWVGKFLKTCTYQRMTPAASVEIGELTARISRLEGMDGHARVAEERVRRYRETGGEPDLPDEPSS